MNKILGTSLLLLFLLTAPLVLNAQYDSDSYIDSMLYEYMLIDATPLPAENFFNIMAEPKLGGLIRGVDFTYNKDEVKASEKNVNPYGSPTEFEDDGFDVVFYMLYPGTNDNGIGYLSYYFDGYKLKEIYLKIMVDKQEYATSIKKEFINYYSSYLDNEAKLENQWNVFTVNNDSEKFILGIAEFYEDGVYEVIVDFFQSE